MKVLYITPFVPYEQIPHAGGYFLYKYLLHMTQHIEVQIIAPKTDANEYAIQELDGKLCVELVGEKEVIRSEIQRKARLIWDSLFNPIELPDKQSESIIHFFKSSGILNEVDLVELQFSQTLPLVKEIKKLRPDVPVIGFEHDVYTQSIQRRVKEAPFSLNKILNVFKLLRVQSIETDLVNRCDGVFVFSSKDKQLLLKMNIQSLIEVLVPAIDIPERASSLTGEPVCLFVGAMDRLENYEAAVWFIKNVWPKVLVSIPNAKLNIVGANPPIELQTMTSENIKITGFVEKLDRYYEEASLSIAPLLTGAGVKFKVLQAMAYGLPIVSTPVGIEGIAENDHTQLFPFTTKDHDCFADGIVLLLKHEDYRRQLGVQLRRWVMDNYNFENNAVKPAIRLYQSLVDSYHSLKTNNQKTS